MIRRPPRSTLFPYRRSSDLGDQPLERRLRRLRGAKTDVRRAGRFASDADVSPGRGLGDRKSTRLNSSHGYISYAVFCLKKKKNTSRPARATTFALARRLHLS